MSFQEYVNMDDERFKEFMKELDNASTESNEAIEEFRESLKVRPDMMKTVYNVFGGIKEAYRSIIRCSNGQHMLMYHVGKLSDKELEALELFTVDELKFLAVNDLKMKRIQL